MFHRSIVREAGEALFGERWQADMAKFLNVSDRAVRRWAGVDEPPEGVRAELSQICRDRARALLQIAERLDGE